MQPTYGPVTDNTCPTTGGDKNIVNGNEADVIPTYEHMSVVVSDLSEDDSYVQGIYRETNFAGS
jgi:hypothetical protein